MSPAGGLDDAPAVPAREQLEADAWCRRRLADALVAGQAGLSGRATGARGVVRPAVAGLVVAVLATVVTAGVLAARATGMLP